MQSNSLKEETLPLWSISQILGGVLVLQGQEVRGGLVNAATVPHAVHFP